MVRYHGSMPRYRHAPLRYVLFAAELHPVARLAERDALDAAHAALRSRLPIREDLPAGSPMGTGARFIHSDHHTAAGVAPDALAIETTAYDGFAAFTEIVFAVLDTVGAIVPGRACRRIGLRYVDEIRIPGIHAGDPAAWAEWLHPGLFPALDSDLSHRPQAREIKGMVEDDLGDQFGVRFAWQSGQGYIVDPHGRLHVPRPAPADQPFFALDTDSFWVEAPGGMSLTIESDELKTAIKRLHDPVEAFFEGSLTDRLRNDIFEADPV